MAETPRVPLDEEQTITDEARAAKAAARKRTEAALYAIAGVSEGLEEGPDLKWITYDNLEATQKRDPNRSVAAFILHAGCGVCGCDGGRCDA